MGSLLSFRTLAELLPVLAAVLLAALWPAVPARLWAAPTRLLGRLAHTPRRAMLWSAVLTFAVSAASFLLSPRTPSIPDEFSYLLAADTFAHGRLSTPPHPLWQHFESFHIVQQPTMQSKYPPGQGLFMAAGEVLTGHPITGVWLSMAAGAAAVCWMLLAWMPPRWALFGALLPGLRFGALPLWGSNWFTYWSTTFWGGAVAMLGGALLFGALPRVLRAGRARDGAWLGAGLIVLANTRPYEGLVVALPVAGVLTVWAWEQWRPGGLRALPASAAPVLAAPGQAESRRVLLRVAGSAAAVLLLGAVAMGYYNFRVTLDPLKMPYQVYTAQYERVPMFVFGTPTPRKSYHHEAMRRYHEGYVMEGYQAKKEGYGLTWDYVELPLDFFWGVVLWPAALFALGRPSRRWAWFAAGTIALLVLASAASSLADKLRPHYVAPAAALFVFLAVAGLRRLRTLRWRGRRIGRPLAEAMMAVALLSVALGMAFRLHYGAPYQDAPLVHDRPRIAAMLEATAGKDLVVVSYSPWHNEHDEWVYNGADLDEAPIVWARDMGPEENRRLLEYYAGRKTWQLYADELPPRLERFAGK